MEMSIETKELFEAFSAFQGEVRDVVRDTKSHQGKYAKLEQVVGETRVLMSKFGLAFTQLCGKISNGVVEIENVVMHKSGQYFSSVMEMPIGEFPRNLSQSQHIGLVISYGRRYGLLAMLGLAQEDNDAQIPVKNQPLPQKKQVQHVQQKALPAPEMDVRKLAIKSLYDLVKKHKVNPELIAAKKKSLCVDTLNDVSEEEARKFINEIKAEYEGDIK